MANGLPLEGTSPTVHKLVWPYHKMAFVFSLLSIDYIFSICIIVGGLYFKEIKRFL
jgi:hypothetical protein